MPITVKIITSGNVTAVSASPGALLSDVLHEAGLANDMPCGGRGICLGCGVRASGGLSEPDESEIRAFGYGGIKDGWRLACKARVLADASVYPSEPRMFENILTSGAAAREAGPAGSQRPDPLYKNWGAAIDIGTTTLCARLYGKSGLCRAVSMKNPQTVFGADVITRIEKSMAGLAQALSGAGLDSVSRMLADLARAEGIAAGDIDALVITGNTAMLYLLTGKNPESLSHAPFEADTLFGGSYTLPGLEAPVYLPRCVSAFVGADITTAILASGMCVRPETSLLVDIGTNGEMALWHGGRLFCCSTAAGPAFEGAGIYMGTYGVNGAVDKVWLENGAIKLSVIGGQRACGICGSGIVDAVSTMLAAGIIDETGAMQEEGHPFVSSLTEINGYPAFELGEGITVTARDIRNVQLAKGSIRAGIETLLHTSGIDYGGVEKLYIAGGFGGYLDLKSAVNIGLIPAELAQKAAVLGNAALDGAAMILGNRALIEKSRAPSESAETVALSSNPVFTDNYIRYMMF